MNLHIYENIKITKKYTHTIRMGKTYGSRHPICERINLNWDKDKYDKRIDEFYVRKCNIIRDINHNGELYVILELDNNKYTLAKKCEGLKEI